MSDAVALPSPAPPHAVSARAASAASLLLEGDALQAADCLPSGIFDLIYVDPPFFSGRRRAGRGTIGFSDAWGDDIDRYEAWLLARLARMRELLAASGSLLVHLDWHAVHTVKVALDRLFGRKQFVNEIIWSYRTGGTSGRWLARKHDTLLFYARSRDYKFRPLRERSYLSHHYGFGNVQIYRDERGPYRWARMRDVWEIPALRGNMPERVDFPTQKPLALLSRIVKMVTDPGDLVGDPMCGSGTTLVAAAQLERRAIGIDICREALELAAARLRETRPAAEATEDLI
jgi:site-specific DNA-methyltransferase (adenine-specific)